MSSDVLERKNRYEESFQSRVMNEWFDPVILAQRLSMDYGDWKGRPLSELILEKGLKGDELTNERLLLPGLCEDIPGKENELKKIQEIKGTKRGASEDLNMKKRKTIRQ
ncbi:hypothetical protein RB195_002787 [Necator americanus]|uniref:Uncharacterized protein n=1 Tax=Necator americanus TaxID=51031 RepID=A0ABR1DLD5_NECAM